MPAIKAIDQFTDDELIQAEEAVAQDNPDYMIASEYLEIKTKDSRLVPLKLNTIQKILVDEIKAMRDAGKPVRIWVLKFRQGGVSTFTEAKIYAHASQKENINALIMADQKEKSSHIFEMSKLFQERLELNHRHLAPELKRSNEKKLEWERKHSQIIITSAENENAARSFTYQLVHLSECAYFRNLNTVLKALLQTVPDNKDTMVIGETTANGLGGDFYNEWRRAKKGETDWKALFLGWYLMDEYQRPLELDGGEYYPLVGVSFDTEGGKNDFLAEENLLRRKYKLTYAQLNWRRWCIVNKCQGDVATFRQEYPSDDEEAFLVSGKCIFDKIRLKNQKLSVTNPIAIGNLVELDGKAVWRDDEDGLFKVYEWPDKDMQIAIGADGARTLEGDPSAAVAVNKKNLRTIMTFHGHVDPDKFAVELRLFGMFCNKAVVAAENNDAGHTTCQKLFKTYGNTYVKTDKNGKLKEVGWRTRVPFRDQMIAELKQEIREDATELVDEGLIDECLSFIKRDDGKIAAADGCHDDRVLARMIVGMVIQESPYKPIKSSWKDGYKNQGSGHVSEWAA